MPYSQSLVIEGYWVTVTERKDGRFYWSRPVPKHLEQGAGRWWGGPFIDSQTAWADVEGARRCGWPKPPAPGGPEPAPWPES